MDRPHLTFDGKGINGPDKHRARIATFTNDKAAKKYGPLFASAPELVAALEHVGCQFFACPGPSKPIKNGFTCHVCAALRYAKGKK